MPSSRSHWLSAFSLCLLLLAPAPSWAIAGIEGTFEFAFDAPWRIEPSPAADGELAYGMIPIQLTIHDANLSAADDKPLGAAGATVEPPGPQRLGRFCELTVTHTTPASGTVRRHYDFDDLAEVERSRGAWHDRGADSEPMQHDVCRLDAGESCPDMAGIAGSSEWYALAWHPVPPGSSPGDHVRLDIEVAVDRYGGCVSTDPAERITLRNHVSVELGRAPLPRFGNGWLYGDLHYHSQGTDNEGEAGHNYRGVVRAMGAMGLDFVFATEHASASDQLIDTDMSVEWGVNLYVDNNWNALRDMNDQRFRTLLEDLHAPLGANRDAAVRAAGSALPQTRLVSGKTPQIFLGGEVDVIPEAAQGLPNYLIPVGNDFVYDVGNLCGGWNSWLAGGTGCSLAPRFEAAYNGYLMRDIQSLNDTDYARLHLVYLPRSASDTEAFVPSYTGDFGGAGRRLAESHNGHSAVGPEIREHGYAFAAHPMSGMGGGSKGPDSMPWTDHMLEKAFREPAILGLQLWNEDTRYEQKLGDDEVQGYERPESIYGEKAPVNYIRRGFYTGYFELDARPYLSGQRSKVDLEERGLLDTIGHGTYAWDRMNLWGLDPARTNTLGWLEAGEARRVFMAGGSDAHGDFNYRREGYFLGDTKLTDTAIGKPRNLVHAGPALPALDLFEGTSGTLALEGPSASSEPAAATFTATADMSLLATTAETQTYAAEYAESYTSGEIYEPQSGSSAPVPLVHSQTQVVDAIADGRFAVTDGPALRIVVDTNRNGEIDSGDTPMGGTVDLYGEDELPVLIEWQSTGDFGAVDRIDLVVGSASGAEARLYGPRFHGARGPGLPSPNPVTTYFDGWQYDQGADHYWQVAGEPLRLILPGGSWQGMQAVAIDLRKLVAARGVDGERFFVRAVAETGGWVTRFAYTNPIWALQRDAASCPTDADRAIDGDGDGLPDGCDACPNTHAGHYATCIDATTTGTTTSAPSSNDDGSDSGSTGIVATLQLVPEEETPSTRAVLTPTPAPTRSVFSFFGF